MLSNSNKPLEGNHREGVVDQFRLCCGSLMDVEFVDDGIVLRCTRCATPWVRAADGMLVRQVVDRPSPLARNGH